MATACESLEFYRSRNAQVHLQQAAQLAAQSHVRPSAARPHRQAIALQQAIAALRPSGSPRPHMLAISSRFRLTWFLDSGAQFCSDHAKRRSRDAQCLRRNK